MRIVSYAQNFEDVILWRALQDVERGRYLDIGAQDPVFDSVSLAFYQAGWRGIHVEATPAYAAKLREARPEEIVIEAAVTDAEGPISFFEIPETGISTGLLDIAKHHEKLGYDPRKIVIPTVRLDQLLAQFEGDVHWLKIDVEGMEPDVLRSWGTSEKRPWVLVIESTFPNTQRPMHDLWISEVLERGYEEVFFDGLSCYFLHRDKAELAHHFRASPNVFDGFDITTDHFSAGRIRSEIHAYDEQLRTARSQVEQVRAELGEATRSGELQRSEVEQVRAELGEATRSGELARREVEQVRVELGEATRSGELARSEQRAALERLVAAEQAHQAAVASLWEDRRAAEEFLRRDAREREDWLRGIVSEADARTAQAQAQIARLEERSAQLQYRVQQAEKNAEAIHEELTRANSAILQLEQIRHQHEISIARAAQESDQLSADNQNLLARLEQAQFETDELRSRLSCLVSEIAAASAASAGPWERIGRALRLARSPRAWQALVDQSNSLRPPARPSGDAEAVLAGTNHVMHSGVGGEARNPYLRANSLAELLNWEDLDFVRCAYVTVLGRQPDTEGEAYYVGRIRRGHSKLEVLWKLRRSPEGPRHDPGIRGFDRALKRARWERSLWGWLIRPFTGGEGDGGAWRQHRAVLSMLERNTREVGEIGRQIHAFRTSPSLWQQHTANDPIPSERHTSQQVEEAVDPYTASLTARERKLYALLKA